MMRKIAVDLPTPSSLQPGPAPMLQWIKIECLVVDDRYQRELGVHNIRAIGQIAGAFRWSRFSPVLVAPIEGGLFAIIDGQHRTHAALLCGLESVPCQVVQMDLREQAASFAAVNGTVTKVTPLQVFKAACEAGEAWALEIVDVCEMAGCRALRSNKNAVRRKPGEIITVAFVRKFIDRHSAARATFILSLFRHAEGIGDDPENYATGIMHPVFEALASRPHLLKDQTETRAMLEAIDLDELKSKADALIAHRRRQGLPSMTRVDVLESIVGDALDKALPASKRTIAAAAVTGAAA